MHSINLDLSGLHDIYNIFDHDQDGLVSVADLMYCMTQFDEPITFIQAFEFVCEFDIDCDLHLNFEEFIKLLAFVA